MVWPVNSVKNDIHLEPLWLIDKFKDENHLHYPLISQLLSIVNCFLKKRYSITDFLFAFVLFKMVPTKEATAEEHLSSIPMDAV